MGADNITDCKCFRGFTGTAGGACAICPAGTYNARIGGTCVACPKGTYQENATEGKSSAVSCVVCDVGKYNDQSGITTVAGCKLCPAHTRSPQGSADATNCTCNAGYTSVEGVSVVCTACERGKYKPSTGAGDCTECLVGKYGESLAQTSEVSCTTCPFASSSASSSSSINDCTCNEGHTTGPNGTACSACVAGTYKDVIGSEPCTSCPVNTLSAQGSADVTNCTCNVGYTGVGRPCTACVAGKYKIALGDAACINCAAGQYSTAVGATSDVCKGCPTNSDGPEASNEQTDCTCNANYYGVNGGACSACPSATSSTQGSVTRIDCVCNTGSPDLLCVAGKYKFESGACACIDCEAGKFSATNGASTCSNCLPGKYLTTSGATSEELCQTCLQNSTAPAASDEQTDCTCNAGSTGPHGGICTTCVAGTYGRGNATCEGCLANSDSPAGSGSLVDCQCNSGYAGPNGGLCTACPSGQWSPVGSKPCSLCPLWRLTGCAAKKTSGTATRWDYAKCECHWDYHDSSRGIMQSVKVEL